MPRQCDVLSPGKIWLPQSPLEKNHGLVSLPRNPIRLGFMDIAVRQRCVRDVSGQNRATRFTSQVSRSVNRNMAGAAWANRTNGHKTKVLDRC